MANSRTGDFLRQCADPLTRDLHESFLAYRIATPMLVWLLHLSPVLALSLQYLFSILALILIHRLVAPWAGTQNGFFLTTAIACSSTIQFPNWLLGVPDSLTHLATAIGMLSSSPLLVGGAVLVGMMNDERMILALPLLGLWRLGRARPNPAGASFRSAAAPLVIGLALALGLRHALTVGWIGSGVSRPLLYAQIQAHVASGTPWLGSWGAWVANLFTGPRWLWLLLAILLVRQVGRFPARKTVFLLGALAAACLGSIIVADVARTLGFVFPAFVIAAGWLSEDSSVKIGPWLRAICALQIITPALWVYENWQWLQFRPLPWEIKIGLHRLFN